MNCESVRKELVLFLYGELPPHEEELVEQHLESCPECGHELVRQKAMLAALDSHEPHVPPTLLTDCRRELRARLQETASRREPGPLRRLLNFLRPKPEVTVRGWMLPAGSLALLAIGFFSASVVTPVSSGQFEPVATRVRHLEPAPDGRIQLVVEETRERRLTGAPNDEPIRRLLLAATRDSSDPGLRVDSVELLKADSASTDVRRALLYSLQHDTNAGVRLKALDGLRPYAGRDEVRSALARVLLADDNAGVRAQAIDLLVQQDNRKEMVGVLQQVMQREDNNYVRLQTQKALQEMRASVNAF